MGAQAQRARACRVRLARRTGAPQRVRVAARRPWGFLVTVVQAQLGFELDEDAATRLAIEHDLHDTLFVEAAAGSGKTKSLVDRVVALVVDAGVPMREIVAVTF